MNDIDMVLSTIVCTDFLKESADADWTTPIPGMDWTVAQAVAHMAESLLWYATDFAAGAAELSAMDLKVRPETPPADLVRTVTSFSAVLAHTLRSSGPDARGWHPYGVTDASGFAGMACDELLVHTYDASQGLGREFEPPADIAEATLRRLYPEAPAGQDPWQTLLWANGRIALPGHPRRTEWRWTLS